MKVEDAIKALRAAKKAVNLHLYMLFKQQRIGYIFRRAAT
jgi:hypothetical protein